MEWEEFNQTVEIKLKEILDQSGEYSGGTVWHEALTKIHETYGKQLAEQEAKKWKEYVYNEENNFMPCFHCLFLEKDHPLYHKFHPLIDPTDT